MKMRTIALIVPLVWIASTAGAQMPLRYEISAPHPASHLLTVRISVPLEFGCPDLAFSAWTPGGYSVNRHAGRVLDARFYDLGGRELQSNKPDLDTWRPKCSGSGGYTVEIRLYSPAPTNPYSAHIDDQILFANLVTVLPYFPAHRDAPALVVVRPPSGWRVACSLPPATGQVLTYLARDWDHLADAILAAAPTLTVLPFTVEETRVSIALTEAPGPDVDLEVVVDAHRKLVGAASRTFKGLPFDRYLFLYKVGPEGSKGGLEHGESTAMGCTRSSITSTSGLLDSMQLAAHELVHAWNVKRARPRSLTPYDYTKIQLTDLLWVAEGWTTYYAPLLLTRAGVYSREEFYEALTEIINRHRANPTNQFLSLSEISQDSWLRWTVPFFTFRTYYFKGALSGLDLDLRLRNLEGASQGLDDLMQLLLTDSELRHRGYALADLKFHAARLAGQPLELWFRRVVESPGYLDISTSLASVGLRVEPDPTVAPASYTGISLEEAATNGGVKIAWVEPDSPAEAAGLGAGDELLAVNGVSGTRDDVSDTLRQLRPNTPALATIRRQGRILRKTITPTQPDPSRVPVRIVEIGQPSNEQRAAKASWLWLDN
jgi:predicted metalloprotease with PDZ domain